MTRARSLVLSLALPLALAACGGGGGAAPADAGGDGASPPGDGGTDVVFMGPTPTGVIPRGGPLDAEAIDYSPLGPDAGPGCCSVQLTLPDPTGDEAWVRVKGDLGPLAGDGVAATWADGAWSATVCVPAGLVTKYHFELPAPADDGGTDADAGVPETGDAAASTPTLWRVNEEALTGFDDDANHVNVAVLSATCEPVGDGDGGSD
jgi:hypothetical protein